MTRPPTQAKLALILGYVPALTGRMPNGPAYAAAWRCRKALEELLNVLTDPSNTRSPSGGRYWPPERRRPFSRDRAFETAQNYPAIHAFFGIAR